ncbi:MAG: flagellar basal-body rod protein FlgF [Pseudomonadota bacterium]
MDNALMIGMQTQMVLQRRMEAVANNIANVATTGFKADNFAFEMDEGAAHDSGKVPDIRFVREAGLVRDMTTGPIAHTGNPLDLAIDGPGFFSVQGQDGQTLYTRDGSFTLAADGRLMTAAGQPVLSESGAPLVFDLRGEEPVIDKTGSISIAGVEAGKIGIFQFDAPEGLEKVGDNSYSAAGQTATPASDSRVIQGALEGSNVRAVVELTRLIEISRAYESAARMVNGDDDLRKNAIQVLGRA